MEEDRIKIVKVEDASFFIEDLFKRSFGDPPPRFPVHYVAFYKTTPATFEAIGYYHVTYREEYALVGGLCVDTRFYRKLRVAKQLALQRRNRGVAERLVRAAFEDVGERKAFFAYVGNPLSKAIIRRVGFIDTEHKYLMVKWMEPLCEAERKRIIAEVAAIGPF